MFSQSQQEAISHKDGPCLTLAGPGSGKTTVLTHRILSLIYEGGISPEHILVITFTRAAAMEMKERFGMLSQDASGTVNFGTFHSVFYRMILTSCHIRQNNLITGQQKTELMKEACHMAQIPPEDNEFYDGLLKEISLVKNTMTSLNSFPSSLVTQEQFQEVYSQYEQLKKKCHRLDFDDMMSRCYQLLLEDPRALAMWQKRFTYLLIDEAQDMNRLQFEIIRMLALPENNIFAVGDDDQSIYGFRGAAPDIMMDFPKTYPGCRVITLSDNYRSCPEIVTASLQLIRHNQKRFCKEIAAAHRMNGIICEEGFEDCYSEYDRVIAIIRQQMVQGVAAEDIAVLFRTNTQALGLMENLTEQGISFYARERMDNPYRHWVARDLISYLRISIGIGSRGDFLRICNRPLRYISRASLDDEDISWEKLLAYYAYDDRMYRRIGELRRQMHFAGGLSSYGALNYIRKGVGYDAYLLDYATGHEMNHKKLAHIAEVIADSARAYGNIRELLIHLQKMDERMEEERRQYGKDRRQGIGLYTLHGSKGLEFHTVIILDVNEGIMPSKKALSPEDMEEERRMFYVGITRAKAALFLMYIKNRNNEVLRASRYIEEMKGIN